MNNTSRDSDYLGHRHIQQAIQVHYQRNIRYVEGLLNIGWCTLAY